MYQNFTAKFFVLMAVMIMAPSIAKTESNKKTFPAGITNHIKYLEALCNAPSDDSTLPKTDLAVVDVADLNQDGIDDYVIDDSKIVCEDKTNPLHPRGGIGVIVFIGTADTADGVKKSFSETLLSVRVERKAESPIVWVGMSPFFCGKTAPEETEVIPLCERPLAWDPTAKMFNIVPFPETKEPTETKEPSNP